MCTKENLYKCTDIPLALVFYIFYKSGICVFQSYVMSQTLGESVGVFLNLCASVGLCASGGGGFHSRSLAVRSDLWSGQLSSIGILTFSADSNTHRRAVSDIKTQLGSHALNNAAGKCITRVLNAQSKSTTLHLNMSKAPLKKVYLH